MKEVMKLRKGMRIIPRRSDDSDAMGVLIAGTLPIYNMYSKVRNKQQSSYAENVF